MITQGEPSSGRSELFYQVVCHRSILYLYGIICTYLIDC